MSHRLHELVEAFEYEIKPEINGLVSERARVRVRQKLLGLERMCRELKSELLKESREIRTARAEKKRNKN